MPLPSHSPRFDYPNNIYEAEIQYEFFGEFKLLFLRVEEQQSGK
jgi:hypothetical protein